MTILNMTIFSKTVKYDYLQYDYFFEKIVIFVLKNKKTYAWRPQSGKKYPLILLFFVGVGRVWVGGVKG